jgi:hypothetical protein
MSDHCRWWSAPDKPREPLTQDDLQRHIEALERAPIITPIWTSSGTCATVLGSFPPDFPTPRIESGES